MADSKVSELTEATTLNPEDKLYIVQGGDSRSISSATIFSNARNLVTKGNVNFDSDVQYLASGGIIDLTKIITHLGLPNTPANLTIPNGTNEQLKIILAISDAGSTFTMQGNIANGANLVFSEIGDTAALLYSSNNWFKIGGTAQIV